MIRKILSFIFICLSMLSLICCSHETVSPEETVKTTFAQISADEAKLIMDTQKDYVILDVRTQEEYDEKHIPGALLIPDTDISSLAPSVLKNKNQLILVYCRSGRRSKLASAELVRMGYTNVKEFGGIIDWPYKTE